MAVWWCSCFVVIYQVAAGKWSLWWEDVISIQNTQKSSKLLIINWKNLWFNATVGVCVIIRVVHQTSNNSVSWYKNCETHTVIHWSFPADEWCYRGNYSVSVWHLSSHKAAFIHTLGVRPGRENTHPVVPLKNFNGSRQVFLNHCLPNV